MTHQPNTCPYCGGPDRCANCGYTCAQVGGLTPEGLCAGCAVKGSQARREAKAVTPMKLYALALQAQRNEYVALRSAVTLAKNEDEAIGKVMDTAKLEWPKNQGWHYHVVSVIAVPDELIQAVTP